MGRWRGMAVSAVAALVLPLAVGSGVLALGGGAASAATPHTTLTVSPTSLSFPDTTLGDFTVQQYTATNNTGSTQTLSFFTASGADPNDFIVGGPDSQSNCPDFNLQTGNVDLQNTHSCVFDVLFFPGKLGARSATLTLTDNHNQPVPGTSVTVSGNGVIGYYQVGTDGSVANFGDATFQGDLSGLPLNKPIVGMAQTGDDGGYWLVASDGGIFPFGDAGFHGSAGGLALNKPIVGMAASPTANGYWLVATDGGIFSYGDAQFFGSTGNLHLNKPIVGMAATITGNGYWLVASDGGIFAYGDAQFFGSTGNLHLNMPIVGMAPTPDNGGYWLVASDGGIFAYGDAQFFGSTGNLHLAQPITAMAAMPDGNGYWFSAFDGGLFNYGTAPFYGSANSQGISNVVGMATDGAPTIQAATDTPALKHPASRAGGESWASPPSGTKLQAGN